MKKFIKIFLLAAIFLPFKIFAQYNLELDSLLTAYNHQTDNMDKVNTLAGLFNATIYSNPEQAKNYAKEQLSISKKIGSTAGSALANYNLGIYYNNKTELDSANIFYIIALDMYKKLGNQSSLALVYFGLSGIEYKKGNYDKAIKQTTDAIKIYSNNNDFYRLAVCYGQKSSINMSKGNYKIALEESLKSLKILDTLNKPIRRADALSQLADIEFELSNYNQALEYNNAALLVYKKYDDNVYQAEAYVDIGNTLYQLRRYDEALKALNESLILSKQYNIKAAHASALANIGKVYYKKNAYQQSLKAFKESLRMFVANESPIDIAHISTQMGNVYLDMNQPDLAIINFNTAIINAEEIDAKKELSLSYLSRSKANESLGNFSNALNDYQKYQLLYGTIYNTTKSQQIEELRTIYKTEKKEQEIILQKNEIQLLEEKSKVNNLQRLLLSIGLAFSLLIFGLGTYALRQKVKRSKLEKEKLIAELEFKRKELTTHALHLAKKNEILESLKNKVEELKVSESGQKGYQQIIQTINFDLQDDNNWNNFRKYFEQVHKGFNNNIKLKFPDITSNELRLMALLKMNLSSKEIANILNISNEGIKKARYRLRKKLNMVSEESLQAQISRF